MELATCAQFAVNNCSISFDVAGKYSSKVWRRHCSLLRFSHVPICHENPLISDLTISKLLHLIVTKPHFFLGHEFQPELRLACLKNAITQQLRIKTDCFMFLAPIQS